MNAREAVLERLADGTVLRVGQAPETGSWRVWRMRGGQWLLMRDSQDKQKVIDFLRHLRKCAEVVAHLNTWHTLEELIEVR